MSLPANEKVCPFCGADNGCRAEDGPKCWCATEPVPAALRALVPEALRMKSCICLSCVRSFKADEKAFVASWSARSPQ